MPKSIFSGAHANLVEVLKAARKSAGVTQAELGRRIGKDQTYVSIIETAQRRVDVVEFCAISIALGQAPTARFMSFVESLPEDFDI